MKPLTLAHTDYTRPVEVWFMSFKTCADAGLINIGVGIINNIPLWPLCNSTTMTPRNPVLLIKAPVVPLLVPSREDASLSIPGIQAPTCPNPR